MRKIYSRIPRQGGYINVYKGTELTQSQLLEVTGGFYFQRQVELGANKSSMLP